MIRLHAICLCLDDAEFLGAAIASVYEHVDGITIGTTYDRDWHGAEAPRSAAVELVLSRVGDPDRKINLVILNETSEARTRNRLMDLADPSRRSRRVTRQHPGDAEPPPVDYFLILDADEVWDGAQIEALRAHVARRKLAFYRIATRAYFSTWRWAIDELEWAMCLVRADRRTNELRRPPRSFIRRAASRLTRGWAPRITARILDCEDVPASIAVFHHGSYVGPRSRIERKLSGFGHAHQVRPNWLTEVYDRWVPGTTRDFHPVWPKVYPASVHCSDEDLPQAILDHDWPPGYLDG